MIPLRDNIHPNIFPFFTLLLIAANIGVFAAELQWTPAEMKTWVGAFGMTPARFTAALDAGSLNPAAYFPLVTSLFLHGGWMHIIGNLWFLWLFGYSVEYCLGHLNFLTFYFVCGIISNLTQVAFDPSSPIPIIGASGAVSGILGAYAVCFPRAKIKTLLPLFFIFTIIEIPAFAFLAIWFIYQLQSGAASLSMGGSGIAWWAHVGGFVSGALLNRLLLKNK
jgi:membrane associated rhomboid family serine protease